ncbi:hypothetical protein V8G54_006720, partial [Vigna mungo]
FSKAIVCPSPAFPCRCNEDVLSRSGSTCLSSEELIILPPLRLLCSYFYWPNPLCAFCSNSCNHFVCPKIVSATSPNASSFPAIRSSASSPPTRTCCPLQPNIPSL